MNYHFTDYEELESLRNKCIKQEQTIKEQNGKIAKLDFALINAKTKIDELEIKLKNGGNNAKPKTPRKTTKREMH